jgi:hypothetical protein
MEGVVIDHIIPKSRGGPNVPWNMQLLHAVCNIRKSDKLTQRAVELAAEHGVELHEPSGRLRHQLRQKQPYRIKPEVTESMRLAALPPTLAELMAICDEVLNPGLGLHVSGASPLHDYQQIAAQLRAKIRSGQITHELPSVLKIAAEAGVAPNTVQRALNILRREGLIRGNRGIGIFVTKKTALAGGHDPQPGDRRRERGDGPGGG